MSKATNFDPSLIESILQDVSSGTTEAVKSKKKETIISKPIIQEEEKKKVELKKQFNVNDVIEQLTSTASSSANSQNSIDDENNDYQEYNEKSIEQSIPQEQTTNIKQNDEQKISNINLQVEKLSAQISQDKHEIIGGKNGEVVNYNHVYEELSSLITYAKETLETLAAIEPDIIDPKQIQATAALISSIRGLVSEFSMIHRMNIKHQYNIELENIKQQHRLSTIEYKQEVRNQNVVDGNNTIINNASIPWSNDLILEFMEFMKQKEQK